MSASDKADLMVLTHLIDARRCLQKARKQARTVEESEEIDYVLNHVEEQISEHVGDDWEEL